MELYFLQLCTAFLHVSIAYTFVLRRHNEPSIFFSIKTTRSFHAERLPLLLDTWISEVANQVKLINFSNNTEFLSKGKENHQLDLYKIYNIL